MLSHSEQTKPPDDWLALSDAERAEVQRKAHDLDLGGDGAIPVPVDTAALISVEASKPKVTKSDPVVPPEQPPSPPTLAEAAELVEALEPDDRMRLIARLWESLPPKNRAAIIAFGLENIQSRMDDVVPPARLPPVSPIWPAVREFLFDPSNTSELYSARRFDLATIFVVTAAYSLLFAGIRALDYGPVTIVAVGALITIVAACQAFFQNTSNPRGVSVVAGAIALSIILATIGIIEPRWFAMPLFAAVIFYGLIGGAVSGYLAGALVGGVFLVADALRKRFSPPDESHDTKPASKAETAGQRESPWD